MSLKNKIGNEHDEKEMCMKKEGTLLVVTDTRPLGVMYRTTNLADQIVLASVHENHNSQT